VRISGVSDSTPPAGPHAELLADEDALVDLDEAGPLPVVAVVGRPNVGKSTLVNRILGRREAVVEDVPGVTRDRVAYDAAWSGRRFTLVDTGGWDPDAEGMAARITAQAEIAAAAADVVVFVVDATVGATDADRPRCSAPPRVVRAESHCSASPMSASPACSTESRAQTGCSSTRSPAPLSIPSTSW
jgi:tRNA U34 5-carboxymethylaminomethyl modifying GTPase MnmE/TrmE